MQKFLMLLFLVLFLPFFSGCAFMADDGRWQAWKDKGVAEESTKQEYLKTRRAQFAAEEKLQANHNPTLLITNYDAVGRITSTVSMDLQPTIAEIAGARQGPDDYGVQITSTPMPHGAFAEGIGATGDAALKVGQSPAVVAGSVGYFIREALDTKNGTEIRAEQLEIRDSFGRIESHATGEGNSSEVATSRDANPVTTTEEIITTGSP